LRHILVSDKIRNFNEINRLAFKSDRLLEKATYPLVTLFPSDFPKHLRNRATRMLGLREKYVFHAGDESYFHQVKPGDKVRFASDLIALYEACLIDLGRSWPQRDFMYPKDIDAAPAPKRRKRHGGDTKGK
jgi:hypothetical protein